ncbi:MAG: TrpR-like protein YerC/YecD [Ruminococcaceae bacterium]|nr:TrpR-like protein YerC/YecD [Oscillospiraceae bacterium]
MNNKKIKNIYMDNLYKAILKLENEEDVADFFEDVCTINELNSIAQRLEVARLLKANTTFSEIEKQTGASSATISRVNRALQYGAGGYDLVL